MNNLSALRSRRFATRKVEPTRQLIAFRLKQEWFALFINSVQKVVPLGNVYGDVRGTGVSLTLYQDRELLVVDVGRRIFGDALSKELFPKYALPPATEPEAIAQPEHLQTLGSGSSVQEQRYLLIVQTSQNSIVGLPINSPPSLRRVPESAFAPLPPGYLSQAHIQCVSLMVTQSQDLPPLFLLEPDLLIET